jgi:hypothetical protein
MHTPARNTRKIMTSTCTCPPLTPFNSVLYSDEAYSWQTLTQSVLVDERGIYTLQFHYDAQTGAGCELTVNLPQADLIYRTFGTTSGYVQVTRERITQDQSGWVNLTFFWICPNADVYSRFDDIVFARTGTIPDDD